MLTNRKRLERAHRYRVMANQLDFHLLAEGMEPEATEHLRAAQDALIRAAAILERVVAPKDLARSSEQ
jgi:hypothetical protein